MNKQRIRTLLATIAILAGIFTVFAAYNVFGSDPSWYTTQEMQCLTAPGATTVSPDGFTGDGACLDGVTSVIQAHWMDLWIGGGVTLVAGLLWWLTGTDTKEHTEVKHSGKQPS